ncbi:MAG: TRAP transporter small permease [Tropicimonas sp.]|uniref:TRAP transporter small permease n=1 Tax=Tropicimonas sp. TaxID=2067044 RepID=UPI003A8B2A5A
MPPALRRTGRILFRLCEAISAAAFAALFIDFVLQVFFRYVLRAPLVWTVEVAGLLFVFLSLFTAATQMGFRDHVRLDLVMEMLPAGPRRLLTCLSMLVFAFFMLASLPDTVAVLEWMWPERTNALRLSLGPMFVLMIFFVASYAIRAVIEAVTIWRRPLDHPAEAPDV